MLELMQRDAGLNGWCKTSAPVMRIVKTLPKELVEYEELVSGAGASRLTPEGKSVLRARAWLP